ncbi:MAG: radical SAM protein [Candidatus Kuenenia sp.]|nr:radical SAM protein [Candidatus Kuenenia hertensis]
MKELIYISENAEIVVGYRYAVAYNFANTRACEFDKSIGAFLIKSLPRTKEILIYIAKKEMLITHQEEQPFKTLLYHLINNSILDTGKEYSFRQSARSTPYIPFTLVLEILTQCNFHCRHCYLGDRLNVQHRLEISQISKILYDAKGIGIQQVQITGGNPSLHPDIHELIELLRYHTFKIFYFSNGMYLDESLLLALKDADAVLHISIYGMSNKSGKWLTGYSNYYDSMMNALSLIEKYGVKIRSLDYMAVEENEHEISRFIEFCKEKKYPYRFDSPATIGNAAATRIKNITEKIVEFEPGIEPQNASPSFRLCSCEFDQPTILANGDVTFCILSNNNFHEHLLGNIYSHTLKEIWFNSRTQQLFRETHVNEQNVCRNCEYKYLCGGICPFSKQFHAIQLTQDGTPDCRRYKDKKFRSWKITC